MAELIGTAEIRVDMPVDQAQRTLNTFVRTANQRLKNLAREAAATSRAVDKTRATATSAADALRTMGQRAATAGTGLRGVRRQADDATKAIRSLRAAAAQNIRVRASVNDDTAAGVASVTAALAGLQSAAASIAVSLDDRTGPGVASITTRIDALKARSAEIKVSLDDRTGPGIAGIRAAITGLRGESPVHIRIVVDGRPAEITAARQAMAGLRTAASDAGGALRTISTRATAASAALDLVENAAGRVEQALRELTAAALAARAALDDLRGVASRLATALRRVEDRAESTANNMVLLGGQADRLSRQMDDLRDSTRDVGDGLRGLRGTIPQVNSAMRSASDSAGQRGGGLAGTLGLVAAAATGVVAALGATVPAIAGVGAALAAVAPSAAAASTGILAIVSANAALKVGLLGVEDALKVAFDPEKADEFAKALKNLSPNARSFVTAIKEAEPAFTRLRKAVQDKLFADLDKTLERTAKVTAPVLRRSLLDSATTLNLMGRGAADAASEMAESGVLGQALASANRGLRNLVDVPGLVVQSLTRLAAAAGPAFERLTQGAADAFDRLSQRTSKAFESGTLEDAISTATSLLKQLGQGLADVGRIFTNVFRSAAVDGGAAIGVFSEVTATLADVTGTKQAQAAFKALFDTMRAVSRAVSGLLGEAFKGLAPVLAALGPPLQTAVRALQSGLTPVIRALSPILTSLATNLGRVVTAFSPLVTVAGQLVGGALRGLEPIIDAVGEQVALLAESVTAFLGPALQQLPKFTDPLFEIFGRLVSTAIRLQNALLIALQPALRQIGRAMGNVYAAVAPLASAFADFIGFGLRGFVAAAQPVITITGKIAAVLAGKLAGALNHLAAWIRENRGTIEGVFRQGERALVAFATAAVAAMPEVFAAFRTLALTAINAFEFIAVGAVKAFGWIPGVGDRIRKASENFLVFSKAAKQGLDRATKEVDDFSRSVTPKLQAKKLQLDIREWRRNIAEAKRQLSDRNLPPRKRAKLEADIRQWSDNIKRAQRQINGVRGVGRRITVTSNAPQVAGRAHNAIRSVRDRRPRIDVSTNAFRVAAAARGAIRSVQSRTVNVHVQFTSSGRSALGAAVRAIGGAAGGLYTGGGFKRGYQAGGLVEGPGTGTSDSVPAPFLSRGEFVVRAAAVRRVGVDFLDMLNSMRGPGMAGGGAIGGAAGPASGRPVVVNNYFTVANHGVLGSRREVEDWFVQTMDRLRRQKRLPAGA